MSMTLYAATVPAFRQALDAIAGLLTTAETYCAENKVAASEIISARLAPDMLPFAFQIKATAFHSHGAIEGIRQGVLAPDRSPPPDSFAALQALVADARGALATVEPVEIDSFIGRDMRLVLGERHLDFLAEDFLLSFSLPNLYFHSTTAYDILRWKGLAIGKRDFLGRLRLKA